MARFEMAMSVSERERVRQKSHVHLDCMAVMNPHTCRRSSQAFTGGRIIITRTRAGWERKLAYMHACTHE